MESDRQRDNTDGRHCPHIMHSAGQPTTKARNEVAERGDVTQHLARIDGDRSRISDELFPLIYSELRALDASFFRQQAPGHTLQPTGT